MTALTWGEVEKRIYETGLDRGVLYVDPNVGIAWNGLVSASESSSGGEVTALYVDGYKYASLVASEEFEATIEAFAYPDEFAQCDGTGSLGNGLFATQQGRKTFNFAYRTLIGNDVKGIELGYKIHLVYNALATPTERQYSTINDSENPLLMSWQITTRPPFVPGQRLTSHLIVDSRATSNETLYAIESLLYGTSNTVARIPTITEVIELFNAALAPIASPVRVTGLTAQALVRTLGADVRVTGMSAEALVTNSGVDTRVGSMAVEALVTNSGVDTRVGSMAVEALVTNSAVDTRVGSMTMQVLVRQEVIRTFDYTGSVQTFTVPNDISSLTVECYGAQGAVAFGTPNTTGLGGYIKTTIAVTPGEVLNLYVGERPPNGTSINAGDNSGGGADGGRGGSGSSSGGGGGGSSDIRRGTALSNRVVVAGGGGGAGTNSNGSDGSSWRDGGPGGGLIGGDSNPSSALGGKGGTQSAGGAAGTPVSGGATNAAPGSLGTGGIGAGSGGYGTGSGGGGGGYYGGGGGGWQTSSQMPGGGGGSSYSSGTIITNTQGVRTGHGRIVITY